MIGVKKPSLEELRHYGVPGMRWRSRKVQIPERNTIVMKPKPTMGLLRPIIRNKQSLDTPKITDASQIKIPEGRRHHNAQIDKWLRDIKAQRLLVENGQKKTDDILAAVGAIPVAKIASGDTNG